jgi:hypothetical protein
LTHAKTDLDAYRDKLLAVQKLGGADLAALRVGRSCPLVHAIVGRSLRIVWILLGVAAGLAAVGLGLSYLVETLAPEQTMVLGGARLGWPVLFVLVAPIFLAIAIHRAWVSLRDRNGPIARVEGSVTRDYGGQRSRQQYFVVSGEVFRGPDEPIVRDLFDHVIPGSSLRLYVTTLRRLVVGVEPLPAPDAP